MRSDRRILFVSELPLTPSTQSFLSRASIALEVAETFCPTAVAFDNFDLIVVDDSRVNKGLAEVLDECSDGGHKMLVLSDSVPDPALLDKAEAFLVAPYSQSELIGAIGDLLGTTMRRAMRMGVALPGKLSRPGDKEAEATVLQLSQTGCLFEVSSPIQVGEEVTIAFVLPSNAEELKLVGTVVSGNELQMLYGMRFADGLESERLAILVFVEHGLATGGSDRPGGPIAAVH